MAGFSSNFAHREKKLKNEVADKEKAKVRESKKQENIEKGAALKKEKAKLAAEENTLPGTVKASLKEQIKKIDQERIRETDKSDRATVESVLDPRTMFLIE